MARYYELKTNKPLYMSRRGKTYSLTYDDSDLPSHYGWKTDARLDELQQRYEEAQRGRSTKKAPPSSKNVFEIIKDLDSKGRWLTVSDGSRLVGQAKIPVETKYLSSQVFSDNLTTLADYVGER